MKFICLFLSAAALCSSYVFPITSQAQSLENLGEQKAVGLNGSITASATSYSATGIDNRRSPFSWTIVGSPVLSLYGVQMPFTFIISEQERNFRQPFDQFGLSPTYKSVTLHLGYRSLSFSKYSLAGATFLGAGFEANTSTIRLAGMYGRFQRAVAEDTNAAHYEVQPAYARFGYAAKVGFGDEKGFIDLIYFHAQDDSNSISAPRTATQITPADNNVISAVTKVVIFEPLTFEAEGAASVYTRDVRDSTLRNSSIPGFLHIALDPKLSTSLLFATRSALAFKIPHFGLRLGYERIEPNFASLGAYYFNTDIENFTFAPSFDLFQNKVRVAGSIGLQHDNILHNRLAQTQRVIGSGSLSWNPAQVFGLDLQFTNYSTGQSGGLRPINDSIQVRDVSQSASFAPRLMFIGTELSHVISLVGAYQQYRDLNSHTNLFTNSTSTTATINYSITFLKTARSLSASLLWANSQTSQISTVLAGGSLNSSLSFFENALVLGGGVGYTHSVVTGVQSAGSTYTENINTTYRIADNDNVSLTVYATQNSASLYQATGFTELTGMLSFTHSFAY